MAVVTDEMAVYIDDPSLTRVHRPYRRGLPPVREYLTDTWRRRSFIVQLARMDQKAEHYDTVFGQLWNILNPLLLAGVYFLLFGVIMDSERGSSEYFSFITAGLFFFHYVRNCAQNGAKALTSGQQLILNTSFPKIVLPISAVVGAFLAFLPTLPIWIAIHLGFGQSLDWGALWLPVLTVLLTVTGMGVAMFFSVATVYFRDTTGFLPYLLRIWLYLSPVLFKVEEVPESVAGYLRLNPLYPAFAAIQDIAGGGSPSLARLGAALAWAVAAIVIGGTIFLYKDRDIAAQF